MQPVNRSWMSQRCTRSWSLHCLCCRPLLNIFSSEFKVNHYFFKKNDKIHHLFHHKPQKYLVAWNCQLTKEAYTFWHLDVHISVHHKCSLFHHEIACTNAAQIIHNSYRTISLWTKTALNLGVRSHDVVNFKDSF